MLTASTIADVRAYVHPQRRSGRRIGLVPTMGYLHEGHLALVQAARAATDVVVASIFVNPLQFGPQEDFATYPRDFDRDRQLLAGAGVDLVFVPAVAEMYPQPQQTTVDVGGLTEHLCGRSRPGHFRGVATVVTKLFHIVAPDAAFFGEKDAQQLAVIRRLALDLNMNIEIVGVPTVREADGLARSSRNTYLNPAERQAATVLSRALALARTRLSAGEQDLDRLRTELTAAIGAESLARVDYVDIVHPQTLVPLHAAAASPGQVLVALAVYIGRTRLIDNATLEVF